MVEIKSAGFVGEIRAEDTIVLFKNCYAAGEVGSIDTPVDAATVGGFMGHTDSENITAENCFYDMQTTAMRNNIAAGNMGTMTRDDVGVSTSSWKGIKGLTTKKLAGKSNVLPSGYVYDDGLYPQLAVMTSHSNALFRAQSAASAATVFCDDWSDLGSTATGFDTVRDTVRAYSFSSTDAFTANLDFEPAHVISPNIANISWKTDGNVSSIDKTSPVVELSTSPYYSLSQSPGVEWAEVDLTYKNGTSVSTGNRRLRLIPTSTITAGSDKRIDTIYDGEGNNNTELYNHNTDFNATYCDATTLLSFLQDNIAHTDALVSFNYVSNITENGNTITGNLSLAFNDKTKTLPISLELIPKSGTEDRPIEYIRAKLTGVYKFEAADRGFYELRYKLSLPDGRYLSASKNLLITQQYVVSYLYNYNGLLGGSNITDTSIYAYKDAIADYNNFDYTSPYGGIAPVRDGYEFAYWSFDKEGMQPVSQVWFDTYEETYGKVRKNLTLYAQWNRGGGDYTLTIDPKQGTYNGENAPTEIKGVAGNKVVLTTATPAPDSREGFVDWVAANSSAGTLTSGGSGQDLLWVYVFGEGDGYISAQYARNIFEVEWFDDVDGSFITTELVAAGASAHVPHHPPRHIGRVFAGFDHMRWECVNEDMEVRLLYAPYIYEIPYDTDSIINQCTIKYPNKGRKINITFTIEKGAFANGDTQRTYSTYCGNDDFVHLSWNGAEKMYGEEGIDESGYWAYNMVFADDNGLGVESITSNAGCDRVKVWCLVEDPTYPIEWVDGHADAGEYKIYDDVEIFISFGRAT